MARPADPNVRIELIAAAERVFAERGLDGARVEDITARAGCSKGAFYQHFDAKEQLFLQIVETLVARLSSLLAERVIRDAEHWTMELLRERWLRRDQAIFEYVWQNRGIVRLVLEGGKSASSAHLMDAIAERVRAHVTDFLAWGIAAGLCRRELDVELTAIFVAGAYDQLARELVRAKSRPDLARFARAIQDHVLAAITDPQVTHLAGRARGRHREAENLGVARRRLRARAVKE